MAKKLKDMTSGDMLAEMSVAGSPAKIVAIMNAMLAVTEIVDNKNAAELINLEFAARRVLADIRNRIRAYERYTGQKIL